MWWVRPRLPIAPSPVIPLQLGGIRNTNGTVNLANSLISGNSATTAQEVANTPGHTINAAANNLFGHNGQTNSQAFDHFTPSGSDINATTDGTGTALANILDTTLQNNGGNTQTHALVSGSPALNRGNNAAPINLVESDLGLDLNNDGDMTDTLTQVREIAWEQRGHGFNRRHDNGTIDIGAYELQTHVPTAIGLSNNAVLENAALGTGVAILFTTDADVGDAHTYTLVAGTGDTDNGTFQIVGNQLQTNGSIDYETQTSHSIRVQTNDGKGGTFEQALTINVTDINEVVPVGGDGTINGTANNDFLFGMANNDTINGLAGRDFLIGQGGDDLLVGGAGADILLGQAGADHYQYNALDESVLGTIDTVSGFDQTEGDRFDINPIAITNAYYAGNLTAQTSLSDAADVAASEFASHEAVFFHYVGRVHLMVDGGTNTYEAANDLLLQVSQFTFKAGDGTAASALTVSDYFV
jgi:hypothetical protein